MLTRRLVFPAFSLGLILLLIVSAFAPAVAIAKTDKAPAIRFEKLVDGQTFKDNILEVKVKVSNFKLDAKAIGKANKAGAGHIAIRFNGEVVLRTAKTSVKLTGYEKGLHSIAVELNNNDQTPLSPAVEAKLSLTLDLSGKQAKVAKDVIILSASAKVAVTIEGQRAAAIKFLKDYNKLGDDFTAAFLGAGLDNPQTLQNPLALNAAVGKLVQAADGLQKRLNELQPPTGIPELVELKKVSDSLAGKLVKAFAEFRSALLAGNASALTRIAAQIEDIGDDSDAELATKLQEEVLAKFNIPDREVGYDRD